MKKILLTGATDGIGLETAKMLAQQGHHLLIHGRNQNKLDKISLELSSQEDDVVVDAYQADLSNFEETRSMLNLIQEQHEYIDLIINNAGVFKTSEHITDKGYDLRFVVNTYAPYLIVKSLLPILADDGRIINLSSAAQAPISIDAMLGRRPITEDFQAYAQSKLAITIWSQSLSKSLKAKQVVIAVNPGSLLASKMVKEGFGVEGNNLKIGADILVRVALSSEFSEVSGLYFDNDLGEISEPHPQSQIAEKCEKIVETIARVVQKGY